MNIEQTQAIMDELKRIITSIPKNEVNVPVIYENINQSSPLKALVTHTEISMSFFTIGNTSIDLFSDIYKISQMYPDSTWDIKESLSVFNEFVKYNQHLQLTELSIEDVKDIIK